MDLRVKMFLSFVGISFLALSACTQTGGVGSASGQGSNSSTQRGEQGVQTPSTTTPSVTSESSAFFERLEIECSFSLRDGVHAIVMIEVVPRLGRGDTKTASVGPFAVQVVMQHLPDLPTNLWVGVFEGSGEPTEPLYSDTADLPDEPEPGVDLLAFHVESDDGSDALTGACRSQ